MAQHGSRFPSRVYGVGEEPDVRFSLANERTYLAWIRTALAMLAVGIALRALDLPIRADLRLVAALVFLAMGTLVPVAAWYGWARVERAVRLRRPLPAPVLAAPVAVGTAAGAAVLLAGLLIR